MTVQVTRDDRTDQEARDEYTRAVQQAAAQRQEVIASRETADGAPDGMSEILQSLTIRVARLEAGRPANQTTPTSQPGARRGPDDPVSNEPLAGRSGNGSSGAPAVINRAVGPVAEDFPWTLPFNPPPPPVLSRTQGPDFIDGPDGNAFIDTTAFLTQSGQLIATTHVQATNLFGGVTTGTLAVVADETGTILARSGLQQIGVDGTWIPFKESNRVVPWTEEFGPDAAARGRTLYIAHFHAGQNRLVEDINAVFGVVTQVADFVATFCRQNPAICSAIAAAFA